VDGLALMWKDTGGRYVSGLLEPCWKGVWLAQVKASSWEDCGMTSSVIGIGLKAFHSRVEFHAIAQLDTTNA
jgi:hypothetical protein